jgi:hypothetical protein
MAELSNNNLLRSWKEVAAHLGCDRRTCYRWEKSFGMPIHRARGETSKSSVFAYKDELDQWFQVTFRSSSLPPVKATNTQKRLLLAALSAVPLIIVGIALAIRGTPVLQQPVDFRIDRSTLIILNKNNKELWKHDTGIEDLQPESFYRAHFQFLSRNEGGSLPSLVIKDINRDGNNEVLFAPKRLGDQTGEGWLFCYNFKGRELWTFLGGKELKCSRKIFSPDYRIAGFDVHDLNADGLLETVVYSFQAPDWPCQMAVLDIHGRKVGEFWNAGYFTQLAYYDIDGDGREEIMVVGANNEYKGGCLIVFDSEKISGCSPQSGEYLCEGLGKGSEKYYVSFPFTDVAKALNLIVEGIKYVEILRNRRILVTSYLHMRYEFDFNLRCLDVSLGHEYQARHIEMKEAGRIQSVLDDVYREKLRMSVRYWDGRVWVAEPTPNLATR